MTKKLRLKFKYLENEKSFYDEIKTINFKELSLKQIKQIFFEGESPTLNLKNSDDKPGGSDEIQMELIKYSPDCLLIEVCNNLNNILENQVNETNFGHSILLQIQKPNKEKGPSKKLRPLSLLNTIRKRVT